MILRKSMSGNLTFYISNLAELAAFALTFSAKTFPGDIIALHGTLGSGKTTLSQSLCKAMGFEGKVTSPTFTLLNEYPTPNLLILHADLYRLEDTEIENFLPELEARLNLPNTIALIEWADKAPQLKPIYTWELTLDTIADNPDARQITITGQRPW